MLKEKQIDDLIAKIQEGSWADRANAAKKLARAGAGTSAIAQQLEAGAKDVRYVCAWVLGETDDEEAVAALTHALNDPSWSVREVAVHSLAKIGGEEAEYALARAALKDSSRRVRRAAADGLSELLSKPKRTN